MLEEIAPRATPRDASKLLAGNELRKIEARFRFGKMTTQGHLTVMRSGALGDSVLTMPATTALRRGFGDLPIHLIFPRMMADVAGSDSFTDVGGTAVASLFDPAADVPPATRATLAGSCFLLAYSSRGDELRKRLQQFVPGEVVVWDPRPPEGFSRHITRHLSQPLRGLGMPVGEWVPCITLSLEQRMHLGRDLGKDLTAKSGRPESGPVVAIHPGSGGTHKCWPKPYYAELIKELLLSGVRVVVLLGPVEAGRPREFGKPAFPGVHSIRPKTVAHLAAVLECVNLFVGNDSGPGHVAAAVGTPTISLFGRTDPVIWRPLGADAAVIASDNQDIASIPVAVVVRTVLGKLEKIQCVAGSEETG